MSTKRGLQKLTHLLLLLWPVVALVNCAYTYRETDSGLSSAQVQERLQSILTTSSSGEGAARLQSAQALLAQSNTSVYYARANASGGPQGRVQDLFPSAFEMVSNGTSLSQVSDLEIFYIYRNEGGSIDSALVIVATKLVSGGTSEGIISTYLGGGSSNGISGMVQNQEFQAVLQGSQGQTLTVSSFDVDPSTSDLNDIIQLEVFNGATVADDALIGKITSLDGRD